MNEAAEARKVLVVDDEPDVEPMFRQQMRREVRAGRYEFLFALSGRHALEVLEEHPDVRLVITDLNISGKLPLPRGAEATGEWLRSAAASVSRS